MIKLSYKIHDNGQHYYARAHYNQNASLRTTYYTSYWLTIILIGYHNWSYKYL